MVEWSREKSGREGEMVLDFIDLTGGWNEREVLVRVFYRHAKGPLLLLKLQALIDCINYAHLKLQQPKPLGRNRRERGEGVQRTEGCFGLKYLFFRAFFCLFLSDNPKGCHSQLVLYNYISSEFVVDLLWRIITILLCFRLRSIRILYPIGLKTVQMLNWTEFYCSLSRSYCSV